MGNRAVVAVRRSSTGLYLHWQGSPPSVYALLDHVQETVAARLGWDDDYTVARLVQAACNRQPGCRSVGLVTVLGWDRESMADLADYGEDNGLYAVAGGCAGFSVRRVRSDLQAGHGDRFLSADEVLQEAAAARAHPNYPDERAVLAENTPRAA